MAFNGSGVFQRLYNWVNDAANGINITATRMDAETDGIATGLSNCITRDGQGKPSAAIDWNAQDLTNVGNFSAANVLSGTYTPTFTAVGNTSGLSGSGFFYSRVGNIVTLSGRMNVSISVASANASFEFTIPIASNFGSAIDLNGTGATSSGPNFGSAMSLSANSSNNKATCSFVSGPSLTSGSYTVVAQYVVH